ncbi:MAG: type IV toxin-antitoxin system AbiEi family antitoxin domain-containing protein, partial [Cyclobacteriaceae bacterium]|nr:type IV toxin-antitoxin system AbiEi family antitoxin domain-containing protein [Cyclobacteriaceae bacterium]
IEGKTTGQSWDWGLTMSTPERAILEAMDELPDHESFHTLDMVFESLTTLRPRLISDLLQACRKIKVKRLFFVFADRHGHAWRKRIDPQAFGLGSGDRALVKGGKIHPRYRIMVPEVFVKPEADSGACGL